MSEDPADDPLDEVRQAASAVLASLRDFVVAAEHVVADRESFVRWVEGGREAVESFMAGFAEGLHPDGPDEPVSDDLGPSTEDE